MSVGNNCIDVEARNCLLKNYPLIKYDLLYKWMENTGYMRAMNQLEKSLDCESN